MNEHPHEHLRATNCYNFTSCPPNTAGVDLLLTQMVFLGQAVRMQRNLLFTVPAVSFRAWFEVCDSCRLSGVSWPPCWGRVTHEHVSQQTVATHNLFNYKSQTHKVMTWGHS